MRNRIRLLALGVVALGGAALTPRPAHATYAPPPALYCCCEVVNGRCANRCCSMFGCSVEANVCSTAISAT
jgi:hypothetical protein